MKVFQMPRFKKYVKKLPRHFQQDDLPEILDIKGWQDEIAKKPFNLKQASEYLGVSSVTLRRWVKTGRILAYKIGRAYTFDVRDLKELKKAHVIKESAKEL